MHAIYYFGKCLMILTLVNSLDSKAYSCTIL